MTNFGMNLADMRKDADTVLGNGTPLVTKTDFLVTGHFCKGNLSVKEF